MHGALEDATGICSPPETHAEHRKKQQKRRSITSARLRANALTAWVSYDTSESVGALRPTHKELASKIAEARTAFASRQVVAVNAPKFAAQLVKLGIGG